jgi:two-component sensor histidine kinase
MMAQAPDEAQRDTRAVARVYITEQLDLRPPKFADHLQEKRAIQDLAMRMAEAPEEVLPRLVDLAMSLTGGASAGLSLYEPQPAPGMFRWRYVRGQMARFEGAAAPRDFSPCGVTLDRNGPVLSLHPERVYDWIAQAGIVVPEALLVPLRVEGGQPVGTLWIVSAREGHFVRDHARAMSELAGFVGVALRMLEAERRLQQSLEEQELLTREMSHRVKNLFAITDGMIRGTARHAADKAEMATALSGRLFALASAHTLVSRSLHEVGRTPRTGDLASLLQAVLAPHEHTDLGLTARFVLDGPHVICGDHTVNGLALIFHELATNAVKYGALAGEGGRVEVRWRMEADDVVLEWIERGGEAISHPPEASGFGGALVRKTIVGQFGGEVAYDWAAEGLTVRMRVPLAQAAL